MTQAAPAATAPAAQPPTLSPSEAPPPERTYRSNKPADNTITPAPADAGTDGNSTYFEAPKLFNPQDRTAQRSAAPVYNAVYHKTVASGAPADGASWHQYDASGWVSASK